MNWTPKFWHQPLWHAAVLVGLGLAPSCGKHEGKARDAAPGTLGADAHSPGASGAPGGAPGAQPGTPGGPAAAGTPTATSMPTALTATYGLKDFDQLARSMAAVTGLNVYTNTVLVKTLASVSSALPGSGDPHGFNGSQHIATVHLGADMCSQWVKTLVASAGKAVAPGVLLTDPPSKALTASNASAAADAMISALWSVPTGMWFSSFPDRQLSHDTVTGLLASLVAGAPDSAATTQLAVTGACTALIASSPLTMLH